MRASLTAFVIGAAFFMGCAAGAQQSLEMRRVVPCQPGAKTYSLMGSNEELCLSPDRIFDKTGVVRVDRYPTVAIAVIEISQAAADRLFEVSSEESTDRVGVLFNDQLIYAPLVANPVKTKTLQLRLKNNPEVVDALVEAFPGAPANP